MKNYPLVLIVDDDQTFHLAVKHALKGKYECRSAYNCDEALAILKNTSTDILLLDVNMRTPDEGLKYLPELKEKDPEASVVISSGLTDFNTVREAMRLGAVDFVPKDFHPNEIFLVLDRVVERSGLLKRTAQQNFEVLSTHQKHALIGSSPEMQKLRTMIEKLRRGSANVVITGETGTGKEIVARQLRTHRQDGSLAPFVAVDAATIQSSMAESILFGHEKGAFTGADRANKGIFEEANEGIVYFDEIGNMPVDIQAKLLRVLQEKEVMRIGSSKAIPLNFRVVCATNRKLEDLVAKGEFKEDLYQRLNVLPVHIPPLREHAQDVPELMLHYLKNTGEPRTSLEILPDTIQVLQDYSWPGNVRELVNLVNYLLTMVEGEEVDVSDLPPHIRDASDLFRRKLSPDLDPDTLNGRFYDLVGDYEKKLLKQAYEHHGANISQIALALGMDRSHLYTKLRTHGIHLSKKR